jgi:hypothetical protein
MSIVPAESATTAIARAALESRRRDRATSLGATNPPAFTKDPPFGAAWMKAPNAAIAGTSCENQGGSTGSVSRTKAAVSRLVKESRRCVTIEDPIP